MGIPRAARSAAHLLWVMVAVVGAVVVGALPAVAAEPVSVTNIEALSTYQVNLARTGYNPNDGITQSAAARFRPLWTDQVPAAIVDEPAVVGGTAYWGDDQGNEHATSSQGTNLWTTNLGTTTACGSTSGVASTATVGQYNGARLIWTGTGDGSVAALNARTGAVIWKTRVAPATSGFVWDSPALYQGSIYIGVSSYGDCPLVRGKVVRLNALTGRVQAVFYTAPSGCLGAGVWASPAVDIQTGTVFVTTGNANCNDPQQNAVVSLNATTLALVGSWQIPASDTTTANSDFGASPTLFTADIAGTTTPMVGAANKDGYFYALVRNSLSSGPVWKYQIAVGGAQPLHDEGSIVTAGFDDQNLYVAGAATTIDGQTCPGSIETLNPADGAVEWQDCLAGDVLGAIHVTPGLAYVSAGDQVLALDAGSGAVVWSFTDPNQVPFEAGVVTWDQNLYVANPDGSLFAFQAG
jgi:outer membrane protein assembly factor BamB